MRSLLGGRKVAIIFDADRMTTEAANGFLKRWRNSQPLPPPPHLGAARDLAGYHPLPLHFHPSQPRRRPGIHRAPAATPRRPRHPLSRARPRSPRRLPARARLHLLLQQARDRISEENDAELKSEEARYKQTTEGGWLDDREDYYKALTEARYVRERALLLDSLIAWWADILRQQQCSSALDLPEFAAETSRLAAAIGTPEALRRLAAIEELRENLGRNIKEDLAIESAFLGAFGDL